MSILRTVGVSPVVGFVLLVCNGVYEYGYCSVPLPPSPPRLRPDSKAKPRSGMSMFCAASVTGAIRRVKPPTNVS